ncbi:MAG: DoxX family membrane protein [Leptolyngbyaceae cyanobacterium SM2_3_12]|nr:DoxX family membrane protein [Leptolyngbyaceae cyanobacterium SM2_3_12]
MAIAANTKDTLRAILAGSMVVVGLLHFVYPEPFVRIVPDFLPAPAALVYLSGVLEILLGLGLLVPSVQQLSAWGLVVLFVAVYSANLNMAINHIHIEGVPDGFWFQAIRLPFQFVLIAWAYWYTRSESPSLS